MSHLIDFSNQRANMAFVGETPWHGLGQKLTEKAPIEVWAKEAGMSHTILRTPVRFTANEALGLVDGMMNDREVLFRSDNKAPLAIVSPRYQIVQPSEILEFYRELVAQTGEYELETAGCLNGGKTYWALARHKDVLDFGGDIVKPYLMLGSSADGSMATVAQHTSVRVVCNNTLQMSLRSDAKEAIRVTHSTKFNADVVKDKLGIHRAISDYKDDVEFLINKALSKEQTVEIFVNLIAKRDEHNNVTNEKNVKKIVTELMDSLERSAGANLQTAKGTAWGAMNAVTHYVDFKASSHSNDNRFNSGQFGSGASLKKAAFQSLVAA